MIPVAGDSLTDLIVQHCLVEFAEAEQMKRKVGNGEDVEYTDIFGVVNTITQEALKEILRPGLEEMAKLAAEEIIRLNGEQPVSAVFVVGGGGIVPGYTTLLADKLGVSAERVAIRGKEVLQSISFDIRNAIQDSLMVTPIGICLSTYDQGNSFTVVELNGIRCKLYNNGRLTISDVIMQAEYPKEDLFPKRGKSVSYIENGKTHIKRGKPGEACRILVNGEEADFTTPIANGDKIEIIPSTRGADAVLEPGQMPVTGKLNVPASMENQKAEDTVTEEAVESDWEQEEQYEEEPEDEPVVRVVRKLMEENTAIECIGYSALTEISERLYGKAPYSNGKGWKAAIKRVQRELIARDKIIVKDAKTVESEYVIFGEHREKGNTQIRGISLSKTLPIDLDALLGKDDENE